MKNLVSIENLDHYGRGIARIEGIPVFVSQAIPGELVNIVITDKKKKYWEAKTVEVVEKSEDRLEPLCPYYNKCGGCNIMHMNYSKQLKFKENKVKEVLSKFANFYNVKSIIGTNYFYYRNKVTLKVDNKVGYYEQKSNVIVPISKCLIADNKINDIINKLDCIKLDNIKEIVIRCTSSQIMLVIYASGPITIDLDSLSMVNTIVLITDKKAILKGNGYIEENINGIKFIISPTSFFQVNTDGMINLYNQVLKYADLKGNENVLDLYCGTGTIGIYLSKYAHKVFGIEINDEAIKDALINKKINNLDNIDFAVGDVKDVLKKNKFRPDIIVVDPPRAGLDKKVIDEIMLLNPKKLIYVSCDVITLARDLNILSQNYNILECTPVDMFPNTYHCESVVILERK